MMKTFITITTLLLFSFTSFPQNKKIKQVEATVRNLVKAMEDGDVAVLNKMAADKLSYGHSGGKVENKEEFVKTFATGASDFVKINISDQTIDVVKKIAIVRHTLEATTNDNNKPGQVKLKVLTVWQKTGSRWCLIARQAVKPPAN